MHIHKIETFLGSKGELLDELTLIDSITEEIIFDDENKTIYFGNIKVNAPVLDQNGQPMFMQMHDIRFPINANDKNEAFDKFEESMKSYLEEQEKLAKEAMKEEESKLIIPNAMDSQIITEQNHLHLTED